MGVGQVLVLMLRLFYELVGRDDGGKRKRSEINFFDLGYSVE